MLYYITVLFYRVSKHADILTTSFRNFFASLQECEYAEV